MDLQICSSVLNGWEKNMEKIKVGAVNYLNTKPLLFGIGQLPVFEKVEIITDYPANIANQLLDGTIDIGLVPVAIIPLMEQHFIVSDYCIASDGPVITVCLFSEVPVEKVEKVLLDYQSRTSVLLARLLFKKFWKKNVSFINTGEGFQNDIKGTTAGLVIGDRAFVQRLSSAYIYDLGQAWKAYSGLPFVYAAWVANKELPRDFIKAFNRANQYGLDRLDQVIEANPYDQYDLKTYYTSNISYTMDIAKRKGLHRFLEEIKQDLE